MRNVLLAAILAVLAALGLISSSVVPAAAAPRTGAATVSATCRAQTAGYHTLTMQVGTKTRTYVVYAPASWSAAKKPPALFLLHGLGGDAQGTINGTKMQFQADKDGFLVVAPQGNGSPSTWDNQSGTNVDGSDASFLYRLPARITTDWCIDASRIYIAGYSAGSVIVHQLACYGGFPYAGYAGAAAQAWWSNCSNPKPFDFVYFHGTADQSAPYNGNASINSVAYAAYGMAALDQCEAQPAATQLGSDVIQYTWSSCAGGKRLLYDIVQGGGHIWPGVDEIPSLGRNTTTISADQVISDFWSLGQSSSSQY